MANLIRACVTAKSGIIYYFRKRKIMYSKNEMHCWLFSRRGKKFSLFQSTDTSSVKSRTSMESNSVYNCHFVAQLTLCYIAVMHFCLETHYAQCSIQHSTFSEKAINEFFSYLVLAFVADMYHQRTSATEANLAHPWNEIQEDALHFTSFFFS